MADKAQSRIIFELDGVICSTDEYHYTSLSAQDFKELYHRRWAIETNYDTLKNKLKSRFFSPQRSGDRTGLLCYCDSS